MAARPSTTPRSGCGGPEAVACTRARGSMSLTLLGDLISVNPLVTGANDRSRRAGAAGGPTVASRHPVLRYRRLRDQGGGGRRRRPAIARRPPDAAGRSRRLRRRAWRDALAAGGTPADAPVAIAIAGVVDPASGRLTCANIPCVDGLAVADELGRRIGRRCIVGNDADCFALAQALRGRRARAADRVRRGARHRRRRRPRDRRAAGARGRRLRRGMGPRAGRGDRSRRRRRCACRAFPAAAAWRAASTRSAPPAGSSGCTRISTAWRAAAARSSRLARRRAGGGAHGRGLDRSRRRAAGDGGQHRGSRHRARSAAGSEASRR